MPMQEFKIVESRVTEDIKNELSRLKTIQEERLFNVTDEIKKSKERFNEMQSLLSTNVPLLARNISRTMGMEEGVQRSLNSSLHGLIRSNKNVRLVLEKGGEHSIELQELILDKMVEQLRQQEKYADMEVQELRKIASEGINWEDAVETATSFMFPVVNSIKGIGESIRQSALKVPYLNKFATREMVEHYKQSFAAATNEIKKHTNDILSPIGILVDPIIGVVKGFGKMMNIFSKPIEYEKETARWQHETFKAIQGLPESFANEIGKITGVLNEQLEFDRQLELERDREIDTPEKSWFEKILTPLLGIGAFILGGIYKSVILPFQIIGSLLSPLTEKLVKGVKGLVSFFKGLPVLSGVSENVQKFSNWVKGLVGTVKGMPLIKPIVEKVTSLFGKIKDFGNKFGFLGRTFKLGMRWLGWPITVIMGLVDFIKGFRNEQGNFIEKIYGGLKEAFLGLFELPIMAIGWITDKILGMFGVEIEGGVSKKIEDAIGWFFDKLGDIYGSIFEFIMGLGSKVPIIGKFFKDSTGENKKVVQIEERTEVQMLKTHKTGTVNLDQVEVRKPVTPSNEISDFNQQASKNDENFLRYLDKMSSEISNAVKQQTQTLRQTTEVNNNNTERLIKETKEKEIVGVSGRKNIPDNVENFGVLLHNSSWGLS